MIPRVFEEFSSGRVLTMERVGGVHLREFLAGDPPQALRDRFGAKVCLAHARLNYARRLLYVDLNPGNILFAPDGTLGLIDFGCVRPYSDDEWSLCRRWHRSVGGSPEERLRVLRDAAGMSDREEFLPGHRQLLEAWAAWERRPYLQGGAFDFGDEGYLIEGATIVRQVFRRRVLRSPTMSISSTPWIFGIVALLNQLRTRSTSGRSTNARPAGWDCRSRRARLPFSQRSDRRSAWQASSPDARQPDSPDGSRCPTAG